jgi:hypothetical protein
MSKNIRRIVLALSSLTTLAIALGAPFKNS